MAKIGEISLENIKEQAREILKIPKSRFQRLGSKISKGKLFHTSARHLFETFVQNICSRRLFKTFVQETFVRDFV